MNIISFACHEAVALWEEVSDATERVPGRSHGTLGWQQKADGTTTTVFYSWLSPQPSGACFVGIKRPLQFNLSKQKGLCLHYRYLAGNQHYRLILETSHSKKEYFNYVGELYIEPEQRQVFVCFDAFCANRRGNKLATQSTIHLNQIQSVGLQIVGRVSEQIQQSGLSALELISIEAIDDD